MMQTHIAALRHKKGWSLNDLARAAGTTKAQIQKLERGERRLSLEWLERIARALGVKISQLLPASEVDCVHDEAGQEILSALAVLSPSQRALLVPLVRDMAAMILKVSSGDGSSAAAIGPVDAQLMSKWALLDEAQRSWALKMLDLARDRPAGVSHAA